MTDLRSLVRRVRWLAIGQGALLGLLVLEAAAMLHLKKEYEKEIVTNGIVIKDTEGRTRSILGTTRMGIPGIIFMDSNEEGRIFLGLKENEHAYLSLKAGSGTAKIMARALSDGRASIWIEDNGRVRMVLSSKPSGETFLSMADEEGNERTSITSGVKGRPQIELTNKKGEIIWMSPKSGGDSSGSVRSKLTTRPSQARQLAGFAEP